jgi:hypothetical protein
MSLALRIWSCRANLALSGFSKMKAQKRGYPNVYTPRPMHAQGMSETYRGKESEV